MAIFVFTDAKVLVNGVDLSDHCSKVTCVDDRNAVDVTTMGSSYEQETKGLGKASITLDFFQDFAAAKVHATLQPLIASSTPVAVEVRPTSGARSATNPAFLLASALLFTYSGLDGSVGDAASMSAEFRNAPAGTGMTYPTS
jgi:hypothetical protein